MLLALRHRKLFQVPLWAVRSLKCFKSYPVPLLAFLMLERSYRLFKDIQCTISSFFTFLSCFKHSWFLLLCHLRSIIFVFLHFCSYSIVLHLIFSIPRGFFSIFIIFFLLCVLLFSITLLWQVVIISRRWPGHLSLFKTWRSRVILT